MKISMPDVMVSLIYRVEQDMWPDDTRSYWVPWSKTEYGTRDDAVAAKGRITAHFGVSEDHLRVVRITVEVLS